MLDDLTIQFFPLWPATPRVGGSANQKFVLCEVFVFRCDLVTTEYRFSFDCCRRCHQENSGARPASSRATPHSVARVPSRVAATVYLTASHTHHLRDNPRWFLQPFCAPAARRSVREGAIETLHRPVFRVSADGPGTPLEVVQSLRECLGPWHFQSLGSCHSRGGAR